MGWLFNKKKNKDKVLKNSISCVHKYKDFPWYLEDFYYTDFCEWKGIIKEPLICVHCGNRIDKVLEARRRVNISKKEAMEMSEALESPYKDRLQPRAIVEDTINDFQLVDHEYLEILEKIRAGQ